MGHFKAKKPKLGFNRPTATAGEVDREWRTVKVRELKLDDIVAGMGIVKLVFETCGVNYYLEAGEKVDGEFDPETEVLAFVKKEN